MGQGKIKKWEAKYNDFKSGKSKVRIQELEDKVTTKIATRDEVKELKSLKSIEVNVDKVTNIIQLKSKLQKEANEIKEEMKRIETLESSNKESKKLEEQLEELNKKRTEVKNKLNQEGLSKEEKGKLEGELTQLNTKVDKNNSDYRNNQEVFKDNIICKNKKLMNLSKEDLQKQSFQLGSKISKCDMVASNLMNGLSWDAIEIKLDNWKERKVTSKEKITDKAKQEKGEKDSIDLEDEIVKQTEEAINEEEEKHKETEPEEKTDEEFEPKSEEKEQEEPEVEETALTEKSKFFDKHPRLAAIKNFFKGIGSKVSKMFKGYEEIAKEPVKEEPVKEEPVEEKEELGKKEADDFKTYLKEVAEKGMDKIEKEKLAEAKMKAHARETEKFGKDYADKSSQIDNEER